MNTDQGPDPMWALCLTFVSGWVAAAIVGLATRSLAWAAAILVSTGVAAFVVGMMTMALTP